MLGEVQKILTHVDSHKREEDIEIFHQIIPNQLHLQEIQNSSEQKDHENLEEIR